ncbi:ABSCISIC ACID-INSENSITIVE 5-like protein 3 isoform X2 [Jatropha curcas]|uniref:ABSCISIC ACID-INSENSITIVE 5-like protein 3 isoform X2 n=1 Tax=Jatropha curcas TaxID=180498 RepID=UPI0005FAB6A3|nr:ABSCISIC ACID-INSENSITIVE 5-like protein 3 isoform X2 [Jatropha curcas]
MASSKVMASSKPKNSDLTSSSAATRSRRASASSSSAGLASASTKPQSNRIKSFYRNLTSSSSLASTMTVDGILRDVYSTPSAESTLLDAQITLIDTPTPVLPTSPPPTLQTATIIETTNHASNSSNQEMNSVVLPQSNKTVDDVWREIVAGRKEMKEEPDEMMTLEDFLAKAGAADVEQDDEVKMPSGGVYAFDPVPPSAFQMLDKVEGSIVGFGNGVEVVAGSEGTVLGRGKRGRAAVMEPLDKAAQQRQRRMIKNRESAARSRERKQAYQVELESMAVRLEAENERLLKEKEERTRERFKQHLCKQDHMILMGRR